MTNTFGHFKQEVLKIYNEINKKIFDTGVKRQRVEIIGDKLMILSVNPRIPALKVADQVNSSLTRTMDTILSDWFKKEIKAVFERQFHMNVVAVLKDYDAETEYSGTIVILDRDLSSYLSE
ncbi:Na-translocating system protein MpsC family protein [Anoxybacillus geothermalis]|nr:hypothetical protein GARCT_p00010 [Geobacillus sp. 12AMOR1]MED4923979.1 Na-translocating system protein MpsC family protein [Anoxybacillus geothermalis]